MTPPLVHLISLGCPKNRVDSEAVIGQLQRAGHRLTPDVERADVVIVNTCGFLRESVAEALSEISAVARLKRTRDLRLVVTGCLVQRMGRELLRQMPQIDSVVGVHGYRSIVAAVEGKKSAIPRDAVEYAAGYYTHRALTTGPGWAYLRIADGCDNRCAYCTIPGIRGPFRSRPLADIIAEARSLAGRGALEIDLVAQDTTSYGVDASGKRRLAGLLRKLDTIDGLRWIRVLYTHPAHYDDGLIDALASCGKVVRYLDLPLQHISDRLLEAMNRRTTRDRVERLIAQLRAAMPGLALRTTFIAGLPGETAAEFGELLDFARAMRFERLGCFCYSAEPGTRAAAMPGQVPLAVKRLRRDALMRQQQRISLSANRAKIGDNVEVLVEGTAGKKGCRYRGRSPAEAPEVDGKVFLSGRQPLRPGTIVPAVIDAAWAYDLGARVASNRSKHCTTNRDR
jgi:ribosomal protein S12 methylthiotransferase